LLLFFVLLFLFLVVVVMVMVVVFRTSDKWAIISYWSKLIIFSFCFCLILDGPGYDCEYTVTKPLSLTIDGSCAKFRCNMSMLEVVQAFMVLCLHFKMLALSNNTHFPKFIWTLCCNLLATAVSRQLW
jgi:hypothetical protein